MVSSSQGAMRCLNTRMPMYPVSTGRTKELRPPCKTAKTACHVFIATYKRLLTITSRSKSSISTHFPRGEPLTKNDTPRSISLNTEPDACKQSLGSRAPTTNRSQADAERHTGTRQHFNNLNEYPFLTLETLLSLQPEDVTYLCSKGAFRLPERRFTKTFIEEYFKRIHPVVPVLEEVSLWNAFHHDPREQISLFVFQALLFASCPVRMPPSSVDRGPYTHTNSSSCPPTFYTSVGLLTKEMHANNCTIEPW